MSISNLKSKDKGSDKATAVSSKQRIESRLPEIYSPKPKTKTGNNKNPKPKGSIKLPEINARPGNNHNLSKVHK